MNRNPKANVLIVEDEELLRSALVFEFKRRGFSVFDAPNGNKALELAKQQRPQVIVTDIRMPDGNGIELLDQIKAENVEMPVVVFITGFADLTFEEAYERGAEAVFLKPFDRHELVAAVEKATQTRLERWARPDQSWPECKFKIELHFSNSGAALEGSLLAFGRGGMFVATDGALPEMQAHATFNILFDEGAPEALRGRGIVRWLRPQGGTDGPRGFGIEIEKMDDVSAEKYCARVDPLGLRAYIPRR